jgi:glyoxylase-like metal-dependent hydrolase (beta-lactamase superfamily II)
MDKVRSLTSQPVRYLLNTHHHMDHAGGNAAMVTMSAATEVIAHLNVLENFLRNRQPGAPPIVFSDQAAVHLGGMEVQARYLGRGHTDGDAVIYFPALRVVHTGDLVIDGMPVIDFANGGSALEFERTLDRLLNLDFDLVIPGHGRLLTKEDVRAYTAKLETMNQRMRDLVARAVPKDQAAAQLKLDDLEWAHTVSTGTFMASIDRYYDEIAAAP